MINIDDFKKVEIRAGKILTAEKVPETGKLLKLSVDFAETREVAAPDGTKKLEPFVRQIISGISAYFPDPATLVGRTFMFVTNLEPRTIKGFESQGMILALKTEAGAFSLLEPNSTIPAGAVAG
jgi:methionine--tRNA ligase beta chain